MSDDPPPQKFKPSKISVVLSVLAVISLAMLAWPAYATYRASKAHSQNLSVVSNLRVIGTGADQFYLEHSVSSVALTDLMGTNSSQYIRHFATHANETYPAVLVQGQAITASRIAGARTITYGN